MRLGFKTAPQHTTWQNLLELWRAADDIDVYDSGWTFDHFYPIFSDSTGPCLEGWTLTTALAQATVRLRLGVMVTGNVYRHPAVLANMAATADVISGGRLELGIGAGWNQEECDAYGIELPPLRTRFDMFDEAVEVIVRLLRDETTTFEGRHYRLTDARCEPKPVQRPTPPIVIGGGGEKRTLRTAARWAQHWNWPGGPASEFARKRDVLHAHCADVGRDPSEIMTSVHLRPGPAGEVGPLVEQAHAYADAGLDLGIVYVNPPHDDPKLLEAYAEALADVVSGR